MKLQSLLTEYDDSLSGDSYIDPLGQLVIWSAYGQQIFRNRVNSVSNDVRNFTLNLMHHGVVRSLLQAEDVEVSSALSDQLGPKDSLPFIHACLIHLENIFTYSMVDHPEQDGIDTMGILGGSKARAILSDKEVSSDPQLIFTDKPDGHLLVRQLGLGVSGRYKTPFVEMGFFDQGYRYFSDTAVERWSEFDRLLGKSVDLKRCFEEAKSHLVQLISTSQYKSQLPPKLSLSGTPSSLRAAYRKAFTTGGKVGAETREFWLAVTGLADGAAGALLRVMEKQLAESKSDEAGNEKLKPEMVVQEAAYQLDPETDERQKLANIQRVEPLLAELDLLFQLARHRKLQTLADVRNHWENLGRSDSTLPECAETVRYNGRVCAVLDGTAKERMNKLLDLACRETVEEQLGALINYHANVMTQRGQLRWVELTRGQEIHNYGRTAPIPAREDRPVGAWVNTYYLHQFNYLVGGYYGGEQ
ncbi:MAG: hypothetical protein RI567_03535 [Marinobacter sp.]|nr:hypothetical protein [Marinobacter sp.]